MTGEPVFVRTEIPWPGRSPRVNTAVFYDRGRAEQAAALCRAWDCRPTVTIHTSLEEVR